MNVVISRLYFVLDCIFFYKLNADCVFYLAVTGELTSASLSLLWTRVAMSACPSLLSYHSSDALVAMDRLPMAIVTYDLLLQRLIVVVIYPSSEGLSTYLPCH
jgi:hypothetical protein